MVPRPLLSLFLAFQPEPVFVSQHSPGIAWRGISAWVIIIVLSIGPLIGLVSLTYGPEEFCIIVLSIKIFVSVL